MNNEQFSPPSFIAYRRLKLIKNMLKTKQETLYLWNKASMKLKYELMSKHALLPEQWVPWGGVGKSYDGNRCGGTRVSDDGLCSHSEEP